MSKRAPRRAAHPSSLELRLLGPFRAVVDDAQVEEHCWARRKAKLLVKVLALSPHHRAHREQIMEMLWPELDERSAASHLNNTLYAARRALEPSLPPRVDSRFIIAHEQQILLDSPGRLWVDVEEFELRAAEAVKGADTAAYEKALGLYDGDLLVEDLYDDWIAERREALRLKRQDLLARLAALWQSQGDDERAAERLRELIAVDATNEEAHRNLMRLYAVTGQRLLALRQYRQCRDALQSGLAAEPERETVELHKQILSHQLKSVPRAPATPSGTPQGPPPTHNLPQELTSFVGRTRELAAVKEALGAARLFTLTGPGGIGKTRLALRAAAELLGEYVDGVWFVELTTLTDASLLPQAVASALGVQGEQNQPLPATLSEYLRHRNVLLVLDNCEHLVGACASLAETLLRACPRLRILATSREALGVAGESIRRVPSLALPDPEGSQTVRTTCASEAVRLFTDRVHLSNPQFRVTERNASAVARLCRQLDGIPLAIELAAARARVLSIEQILSKLDDRFRLLVGRAGAASPQHQTLRATIDWSYNLLAEGERSLFMRLSVFAGGCTLEAIEAVCADEQATDEAFDLLSRLADKSFIFVEPRDAETRYQMLETIRRYGQERLRESGEESALAARHFDWFLRLAEQAEREMWKSGQSELLWVTRLDAERENLRAALAHAAENGEAEAGLRIAGALWRFWATRGYLSEGREWFEKLLALGEAGQVAPAVRAKACARAGALARDQGDFARGVALLEQGLSLYRAAGDAWGAAATLNGLGDAAQQQGDDEQAVARYEESLSLFRALGDKRAAAYLTHNIANVAKERGDDERATELHLQALAVFRELEDQRAAATALFNLGEIAHHQRDFKRAGALHTQSLEIRREINDKRGVIFSLIDLGNLARDEGDNERATALYEESLLLSRELGDKRSVAFCFEGLAAEACRRGDHQRAARLLASAEALREAIGAPIPSIIRDDYERRLAHVCAGLDRETFDAAWTHGRAITLEQAVEMALTRNPD